MEIHRACGLENPVELEYALPHPIDVDLDAALPAVLK
jgi:hypothetical protein